MPDPFLDDSDRRLLTSILAHRPEFTDSGERGRRVFSQQAGFETILGDMKWEGTPGEVAADVVGRLESHGCLSSEPKHHALGLLVEHLIRQTDLSSDDHDFLSRITDGYRLANLPVETGTITDTTKRSKPCWLRRKIDKPIHLHLVIALAIAIIIVGIVLRALIGHPASPTPMPTGPSTFPSSTALTATLESSTPTPGPPTATVEPPASPTPMVLPDNVKITEKGAIITEPIYLELVRIPQGGLQMGSDPEDSQAKDDEKPPHKVSLAEFYIGKYEVTNAQYAAFVKAKGYPAPDYWQNGNIPPGKEDHPVVKISWNDAVAFTEWLSEKNDVTFRLCIEAEWEKACRGKNGFIYPWGDMADTGKANVSESRINDETTKPVGTYSPKGDSSDGVSDMAGNVWEWVADWYGKKYYESSPEDNPQGPATEQESTFSTRVRRGGSYIYSVKDARCATRSFGEPLNTRYPDLGLRVCAEMPHE